MTRTEITPIDKGTHLQCDITKHNERIAKKIGIPVGEPIGRLSPKDMDRYTTAMCQRSGLNGEDGRRVVNTVKAQYEQAIRDNNEVESARITMIVRSATTGLLGVEKNKQESNSLQQETTVFEG